MKTIRLTPRSQMLHIDAPGCIVNIDPGLIDSNGRMVCRVDVNADGDRYKGDAQWWVEGEAGNRGVGLRIIQTNTPTAAPAPMDRDGITALLQRLVDWQEATGGWDAPVWREAEAMLRKLKGEPEPELEEEEG
jgi:hypothetical protein